MSNNIIASNNDPDDDSSRVDGNEEKQGEETSKANNVNRVRSYTSATAEASDTMNEVLDDDDVDIETGGGGAAHHQPADSKDHNMCPPLSYMERFRDGLLRLLDGPIFQGLGLVVLALIVMDGAFFFFLLVGWHNMCDEPSPTDCDPRNYWYNWSIQFLNVLFTYSNLVSFPWRAANFRHLTCPRRSNNTVGHNLHGLPDPEVWFHIPLTRRLGITTLLLWNAIFQFINQGTRIVFSNYDAQATMPGLVWTNVFFALSFLCGGVAGVWLLWEMADLRQAHPGKFGLGPIDSLKEHYRQHLQGGQDKHNPPEEEEDYVDPTRDPNHTVLVGDSHGRASMRLFGL